MSETFNGMSQKLMGESHIGREWRFSVCAIVAEPWMCQKGRLANRLLQDRALAEDAVQEAFISVFRGLEEFECAQAIRPAIFLT